MQVALYARVSTSQQEKMDTIDSQLAALQAYVASQEYTLFPEHIFLDNGVSGSRLDRPALDRLRDQARLGDFEAVILLSPDRLARSYPVWSKYSCSLALVVFQEPAKSFTALNRAFMLACRAGLRKKQDVALALMI